MYITFDEIMSYKMKVEGLQAENERLILKHENETQNVKTWVENKELKAEIKELKEDAKWIK